jgi:lambda repressor-like predicted transcriptional regulator
MRKQSSALRNHEAAAVDDRYLSLRSLATYAGLSIRTLRGYLGRRHAPLPHYRIGGKILVRRSEFDRWASEFKIVRPHVDLEALVGDVVRGLG